MLRDTYKYVLKDWLGNIVYIGITNDLERRKAEHQRDGKIFAYIEQVGDITTYDDAAEWEKCAIQEYKIRYNHLPRYNQNETGK